MLIKKKKDRGADIEAGSMADITFLLLLFFLVTTTIDVDTGIGMTLPEYQEDVEVAPISKERMAAILVNEAGQVLLGGEIIAIPQIKDNLKERIKSKLDLPANKKLIVSIKTERTTNYNLYIQTLDQIKGAYQELKDELARGMYGKEYRELTPEEEKPIREKVRETISIAEPEQVGK